MQAYNFEASFNVRAISLQRRESEREAEQYRNDFSHHINPLRDWDDQLRMMATVMAPKGMDDSQSKAFQNCMNNAMRRFEADFQYSLQQIAIARETENA